MKFKEIEFADSNAKRIYKDYILRIQNTTKILASNNREEILMEVNSHIFESFQNDNSETNDVEKLLNILEKIGQPEVFLKELVAQKKLEESTKTFNPIKILKALILNLGNGFSYVLFFILYLLLFAFIFLIFAKIFDPENVGFFYNARDIFVLGKISSSTENYGQYEQLGNLFIPVMIVLTVISFVIITLLLRLKKTINIKLR
ncbi:hypothetical protein SAMN05660477_01015 [Soonwooa buanensis]|uniref:DUF1700 domain-containing protein n=1 Tax=Soonwooa buanensis TaxID=619805 RepID=A0A1T5DTV5_9FLAO|nr:hypothetical protein [Soonwooa buanensis]SKB75198.1 hypothetical protein SAMN05660477_01015 [Soonwooa buanensis]